MSQYHDPPRKQHRCLIDVQVGAWVAQEQSETVNGDFIAYGPAIPLTIVAAPADQVSIAGTKTSALLTAKTGMLVQAVPNLAVVQWVLPLSSLPGYSNKMGATHDMRVTCDVLPTQINSFLGVVLAAPSGDWDSTSESISGMSFGYGNTAVASFKHFVGTGSWTTVAADAATTQVQTLYAPGCANLDKRSMSETALIQSTHQTAPTTLATHLYITLFAITAGLLGDCVYTNPRITIKYGE